MHKPLILVAAALLLGTGAAQAQSALLPGPYLVAAAGGSSFETDCSGLSSCDKSGDAFKFVAGYRLGGGLAVEGLVLDFGRTSGALGGATAELKVRAIGGGAALHLDAAPHLGITLRLGMASVRAEGTGSSGGVIVTNDSESSLQPYVGMAVQFAFTKTVALELAWDNTRGEFQGDGGRVSAFTAGVRVSF